MPSNHKQKYLIVDNATERYIMFDRKIDVCINA